MNRLFLAAWPTDEVRTRLAAVIARAPADGERRVQSPNWHITLQFIGQADAAVVADRVRAAELPTVTATLGPVVVALHRRHAVIPVAGVDSLAAVIRLALIGVGRNDARPFFGHLTVARLRDGVDSTLLGVGIAASFTIDRVTLVSSDTLSGGVVYTPLAEFPTST